MDSLELAARVTEHRWVSPIATVARMMVALTDGLTIGWLVDRDDAVAEQTVRAAATSIASLAEPDS